MTVQGGGGGRKVPPGSAPPTTARSETGSTPPVKVTAPAAPAVPGKEAAPKDAFDARHTDPRLSSERAALPMSDGHTTSGINSMVRVLEDTRAQILDEHKALREKLQRVVGELARSGFERSLLDSRRDELTALRQRLSTLRRRLQHIQRRMKGALGKSRTADADVTKNLTAQLERLQKLEPGVQRALVALSAIEQACGGEAFAGSSLKLVGDASAEERGTALAHAMPGAAVAQGIAHLLAHAQPEQPLQSPSSSSSPAGNDPVENLQGLANALLTSL